MRALSWRAARWLPPLRFLFWALVVSGQSTLPFSVLQIKKRATEHPTPRGPCAWCTRCPEEMGAALLGLRFPRKGPRLINPVRLVSKRMFWLVR